MSEWEFTHPVLISEDRDAVPTRAGRVMSRMVADILPLAHERRIREDADALPHYERGIALYDEGQYQEAIAAFRVAADLGHPDAQYRLAEMLLEGETGEVDNASAGYWFRRAANQGDARAMHQLGHLCESGMELAGDQEGTLGWFRMAAESGHAGAQFRLGEKYHLGLGVSVELTLAFRWFRMAAESGHAGAQFRLGEKYHLGLGVSVELTLAFRWYRKAAEQGHPLAKYNLGIMYEKGRGVPQNDNEFIHSTKPTSGLDPEALRHGINLAGYHVEAGARSFADYSKAMIEDVGEVIRPYLKILYDAIRSLHGFSGMSTAEEVEQFLAAEETEAAQPRVSKKKTTAKKKAAAKKKTTAKSAREQKLRKREAPPAKAKLGAEVQQV